MAYLGDLTRPDPRIRFALDREAASEPTSALVAPGFGAPGAVDLGLGPSPTPHAAETESEPARVALLDHSFRAFEPWRWQDSPVNEEIQQIVDEVAHDLRRGIVLEDDQHSLIAYSAHAHTDSIRQQALLLRQTPENAIAWVTEQGLLDATEPLRISANPRLKAESRVCTPIRDEGRLRGFLSVLDPDETLSGADLTRCAEAAEALRHLLHDLRAAQEMPPARERELVDRLIAWPDSEARIAAHARLVNERRLTTGPLVVIVVRVRPVAGSDASAVDEHVLSQIIRRERHASPPHTLAATAYTGSVVLVISDTTSPERLADRASRALGALVAGGVLDAPPLVSFGEVVTDGASVARSYRHAVAASRIAAAVPGLALKPLGWESLGVYQTLVHIPDDELGRNSMDERIRRLEDRPELLHTLETYLELAGNAKRATEALALHRASLYYRLGKVEKIAEIDLKLGADQIGAYLAIKSLRLSGRLD